MPVWPLLMLAVVFAPRGASAQLSDLYTGDPIPRDVREMYEKGLDYLVQTQQEEGGWQDSYGGPGTTGMAVMCFLASGKTRTSASIRATSVVPSAT
ncbi:MAG: hypothetical protein R3B90_20850 [Planctomycetaceae bacterium]